MNIDRCVAGIYSVINNYLKENNMKRLSRSVRMICKICGNDMFEFLDKTDDLISAPENTKLRCSDCKKIYTKQELIDDNEEAVNSYICKFR